MTPVWTSLLFCKSTSKWSLHKSKGMHKLRTQKIAESLRSKHAFLLATRDPKSAYFLPSKKMEWCTCYQNSNSLQFLTVALSGSGTPLYSYLPSANFNSPRHSSQNSLLSQQYLHLQYYPLMFTDKSWC